MVWTTHRVWEISTTDHELFWHPYVREIASACDELAAVEPRFDARIRADRKQLTQAVSPPAVGVPRPIRRAALRLLKNSVLRAALLRLLTFLPRSDAARLHFSCDASREAALFATI